MRDIKVDVFPGFMDMYIYRHLLITTKYKTTTAEAREYGNRKKKRKPNNETTLPITYNSPILLRALSSVPASS